VGVDADHHRHGGAFLERWAGEHREGRPTLGRDSPLLSHSRSGAGRTAQPFLSQLKPDGSGVCRATCRHPETLWLQTQGSYPPFNKSEAAITTMTQPAPARITVGSTPTPRSTSRWPRQLWSAPGCHQHPNHPGRLCRVAGLGAAPGPINAWGIEGTGSFGAGLTRFLHRHGQVVVEVNRPDRQARRRRGKSDPLDAEANAALYRIVIARLRHDQQTRDHLDRRIREGKSKKEAIRCLKRYVAREVFAALQP
jgi:hypothetical protein